MDHTITHACGHMQIHYVLGFTQQQLRKVGRIEATLCDSCRRTAKRANSAGAVAEQTSAHSQFALASLNGSPRQIAWAGTIRTMRLTSLLADPERGMADACRSCAVITEAKWWIDHRNLPTADLVARAIANATPSVVVVAVAV